MCKEDKIVVYLYLIELTENELIRDTLESEVDKLLKRRKGK